VFPLSTDAGPDGALNTVAPLYGDVVTIPETLASYRVHGQNLWSNTGGDAERLPARIRMRQAEVALLRRHAAELGVSLSARNVLDHELAFLNYRLMAKKLGLAYPGCEADTISSLLSKAWQLLQQGGYSLRQLAAHGAWFSVLAASPMAATRGLMRLRFRRGALQGTLSDVQALWRRSFA
jgi:hypothetical protein